MNTLIMDKIKPRPAEEWLDKVKEVMQEQKCNLYVAIMRVEEETRQKVSEVIES